MTNSISKNLFKGFKARYKTVSECTFCCTYNLFAMNFQQFTIGKPLGIKDIFFYRFFIKQLKIFVNRAIYVTISVCLWNIMLFHLLSWSRHQNDSQTELWRHNNNLLKNGHARLWRVDKTTQICAAHRFLSWEQRTICTCCVLAKIVFQMMVINFKKPAYFMSHKSCSMKFTDVIVTSPVDHMISLLPLFHI